MNKENLKNKPREIFKIVLPLLEKLAEEKIIPAIIKKII